MRGQNVGQRLHKKMFENTESVLSQAAASGAPYRISVLESPWNLPGGAQISAWNLRSSTGGTSDRALELLIQPWNPTSSPRASNRALGPRIAQQSAQGDARLSLTHTHPRLLPDVLHC